MLSNKSCCHHFACEPSMHDGLLLARAHDAQKSRCADDVTDASECFHRHEREFDPVNKHAIRIEVHRRSRDKSSWC